MTLITYIEAYENVINVVTEQSAPLPPVIHTTGNITVPFRTIPPKKHLYQKFAALKPPLNYLYPYPDNFLVR